jgi:site-specific recombinase XerD
LFSKIEVSEGINLGSLTGTKLSKATFWALVMEPPKEAGIIHSISPHTLRHFLFTWLKKQGIDDALIQPYSGHESRQSLEIYSKLSIGDAQENYENIIRKFPV